MLKLVGFTTGFMITIMVLAFAGILGMVAGRTACAETLLEFDTGGGITVVPGGVKYDLGGGISMTVPDDRANDPSVTITVPEYAAEPEENNYWGAPEEPPAYEDYTYEGDDNPYSDD